MGFQPAVTTLVTSCSSAEIAVPERYAFTEEYGEWEIKWHHAAIIRPAPSREASAGGRRRTSPCRMPWRCGHVLLLPPPRSHQGQQSALRTGPRLEKRRHLSPSHLSPRAARHAGDLPAQGGRMRAGSVWALLWERTEARGRRQRRRRRMRLRRLLLRYYPPGAERSGARGGRGLFSALPAAVVARRGRGRGRGRACGLPLAGVPVREVRGGPPCRHGGFPYPSQGPGQGWAGGWRTGGWVGCRCKCCGAAAGWGESGWKQLVAHLSCN